jgi:hypothetical protein
MGRKKSLMKGKKTVYECRNLVYERGRCSCTYGKRLGSSPDGSIGAEAILMGVIPDVCKSCGLFNSCLEAG